MTIKFKNKSMNFFYKMMMIRFEMGIDEVKRVNIKQLNTFLKNEMAGVIFIHAITEYIKIHFDEYVKEYGDGAEKLSNVNINIVKDTFYRTYQNEIKPAWKKLLSTM
ncbi:hypothetical protein [Klebsiella sp. CLS1-2]|uniref:hypothetical protein n=1 Tax=Klebsiella sp. CLS1-2 TaxID=3115419 RepID=UPI003075D88D